MKLPPLNAVRAFEACARHGSFRLAAEELCVTPGAVSQQVKLLEDWLGVRLFERRAGGVALTAAGTQLQQTAGRSLRALAHAAERLRPDARTVRVSSLVSFTARWLMPRLDGFTRLHPSIQVQIDATNAVADFEHDGVHLAIRHASADPAGLDWHELVRERLWPVCTPAYARLHVRRGQLLASARLLHELDGTYAEYWRRWIAEHADGEPIEAAGGLFFSHEMLAHDAARAGQGVALANPFLVAPELASGALQVAVDAPLSTGKRYLVVWPKRPLPEPARLFRDWLIEAFAQQAAWQAGQGVRVHLQGQGRAGDAGARAGPAGRHRQGRAQRWLPRPQGPPLMADAPFNVPAGRGAVSEVGVMPGSESAAKM